MQAAAHRVTTLRRWRSPPKIRYNRGKISPSGYCTMVDPLSITAGTILAYALPKLLDASLEKVGELLTEEAID
ncbi:MAG: hypothetical protein Fur0046_36930 [Cyanobacteria bacterium J069]